MDKFGIGNIGLPGFGIDDFRLPVFGNDYGGNDYGGHKSLVDAWIMSGYSNDNPPASIRGVKGHALYMKNLLFTPESGFGRGAYEGALVFDGVDDYAVCKGLPIQTDYTVICRRDIITVKNGSAVASKRTYPDDTGVFGAFVLERVFSAGNKALYSFGRTNGIDSFNPNGVIWQTKTSYNGKSIAAGSADDSETLSLGANAYNINLERCQELSNIAVYYFALYSKSLTPEEIEVEKEWLHNEWNKKLSV